MVGRLVQRHLCFMRSIRRCFSLNRYAALRTLLHDSVLFILYTIITRRCITESCYTWLRMFAVLLWHIVTKHANRYHCLLHRSFYSSSSRLIRFWKIALRLLMSTPAISLLLLSYYNAARHISLRLEEKKKKRENKNKSQPWNIALERNNVNRVNLSTSKFNQTYNINIQRNNNPYANFSTKRSKKKKKMKAEKIFLGVE